MKSWGLSFDSFPLDRNWGMSNLFGESRVNIQVCSFAGNGLKKWGKCGSDLLVLFEE